MAASSDLAAQGVIALDIGLVRQAGPDIAILVDALHFDRSGSTPDQLAALPLSRLRMVHLCDAPVQPPYSTEHLLHTARAERLPPGEGQIDLPGFLKTLPRDLPVALEVPMTESTARDGADAVLRRIMTGYRRVAEQAALAAGR